MKLDHQDLGQKVLVVAEIGNNHEGRFDTACHLVEAAAKAGADAVKVQVFRTEHYVDRTNPARFDQLKKFELSEAEFAQLKDQASTLGLLFLATPFDLGSAHFLAPLVSAYKIASGDNTFYPLLEVVARTGKPVVLSSGLADMAVLRSSKAFLEGVWAEAELMGDLAVLHCVTSYPVPPEEANLGAILDLERQLGCTIGYSDHTLGIEAAVLATALGARLIEKHFTLDKNASSFRDHQLSATPEEFRQMVERIRLAERLRGTGRKEPQPGEKALMPHVRRSIAAAHPLQPGEWLRFEDLTWLRPAGGLPPGQEKRILGKRLKVPVEAGAWLLPEMME